MATKRYFQCLKIFSVKPISSCYLQDQKDIYIGYTTSKYLHTYLSGQKSNYKAYKDGDERRRPQSIFKLFDKYGVENCKIFLLESYPCNNIDEARARINYWKGKKDDDKPLEPLPPVIQPQSKVNGIVCECGEEYEKKDEVKHKLTKNHITKIKKKTINKNDAKPLVQKGRAGSDSD